MDCRYGILWLAGPGWQAGGRLRDMLQALVLSISCGNAVCAGGGRRACSLMGILCGEKDLGPLLWRLEHADLDDAMRRVDWEAFRFSCCYARKL